MFARNCEFTNQDKNVTLNSAYFNNMYILRTVYECIHVWAGSSLANNHIIKNR